MEIFLFIIAAGVIAHLIGASVHEGIFVGALVCPAPSQPPLHGKPEAFFELLIHDPSWHAAHHWHCLPASFPIFIGA